MKVSSNETYGFVGGFAFGKNTPAMVVAK